MVKYWLGALLNTMNTYICKSCLVFARQSPVGQGLTCNDAPKSVGLLWACDQLATDIVYIVAVKFVTTTTGLCEKLFVMQTNSYSWLIDIANITIYKILYHSERTESKDSSILHITRSLKEVYFPWMASHFYQYHSSRTHTFVPCLRWQ